MIENNRQNAHQEIDHIFKKLLPAHGMAERPVQVALSHRMLDAMLDDSIALCDAGTGIGKTYAYLHRVQSEPRRQGTGESAGAHFYLQHRLAERGAGGIPALSLLCADRGSDDKDPHPGSASKGEKPLCVRRASETAPAGCGSDTEKPAGKRRPAVSPGSSGPGHGRAPQRECVSVCPWSVTVDERAVGINALWRCVPRIGTRCRSATTICCWQTPFTGTWAAGPCSRSGVP